MKREDVTLYDQVLDPREILSYLPREFKDKLSAREERYIEEAFYLAVCRYANKYDDTYLNKIQPDYRTLCRHSEIDDALVGDEKAQPFMPDGAIDGKVVDATMAGNMEFVARWGAACGMAFDAKKFLQDHTQYDWMEGILQDRPSEPWTVFKAGEK